MSATIYQFTGGKHVRQIPITVSPPETNPLRSVSRGFDRHYNDDSYVLTVPTRVALEAFWFAGMCVLILFACMVAW